MKTKALVYSCILLGVGFVLHSIVPGIGTMKPDFLLAMMILAIIINPTMKNALITGFIAAIMSALTTVFPGGQILSIFDKMISAFVVITIYRLVSDKKYGGQLVTFVGTLVSGFVFVIGAMILSGMDVGLLSLVWIVVLPTGVLNTLLNHIILTRVLDQSRL